MVKTVVAQAIAGSTSVARPGSACSARTSRRDIAASLGLASPHGALVTHVDDGSPAAKAGLKVGDLIVKAADADVGDSASFDYRLAIAGIGKPVRLDVCATARRMTFSVVAEAEPELDAGRPDASSADTAR